MNELFAHKADVFVPVHGTVANADVYFKDKVDPVISELKAENRRLNNALDKERSETIKYMDELCNAKNEIERLTIDKRNDELRADVADGTVEKLKAENEKLKQKLEDAKATAYTESVDAGMRERRLRRALYKACANWALSTLAWLDCIDQGEPRKWSEMVQKCRAKAKEA